ncbi:MAG: hypothetical protein PVG99_13380 [Desulfobacteraceae bacterium]|jgi:hypothetical protein
MAPYKFDDEAKATDEELANEMRKLVALSDERISELLPKRADQDQLKALIEAVNAEASENRKKAVLLDRLATVSAAVKEVVKGFIKVAV